MVDFRIDELSEELSQRNVDEVIEISGMLDAEYESISRVPVREIEKDEGGQDDEYLRLSMPLR